MGTAIIRPVKTPRSSKAYKVLLERLAGLKANFKAAETKGGMKKIQLVSAILLIAVNLIASVAATFDLPTSVPSLVFTEIPSDISPDLIQSMFRTAVGAIAVKLIAELIRAPARVPYLPNMYGARHFLETDTRDTALATAKQ
jgi:hypothetical protein